jgi:transposase
MLPGPKSRDTFGLTWIRADRLAGDTIADGFTGHGTDPSCRRARWAVPRTDIAAARPGTLKRPSWRRPRYGLLRVDDPAVVVIQALKPEPRIMRYELNDFEWTAIKPMLPNKPRGVRRVNDRRVLNSIFWVLRSGAPWPKNYGPYTTCYYRFVRWRRAGVWDQIMDALTAAHDAAVQMIDTSVVRVHQHGACVADNKQQHGPVPRRADKRDPRCRRRQWLARTIGPYTRRDSRQPTLH